MAVNLNNVPNSGKWTEASSTINTNFNHVKVELDKQKEDRENNKGIFGTIASLQAQYPIADTIKGWFAFVGTANPYKKYEIRANKGQWVDTGETFDIADVDLAEYAKKNEVSIKADAINVNNAPVIYEDSDKLLKSILSSYLFALTTSDQKKLLTFDHLARPYIVNLWYALRGQVSEESLTEDLAKAIEPIQNLEVIQNDRWSFAIRIGDQIAFGINRIDNSVYCNKLFVGNSTSEDKDVPYRAYVVPQSLENVLTATQDWETGGMFFYNVLKKPDGTWGMWYHSFKSGWTNEFQGFLNYAHSVDGKNWIKEIPGRDNNIIHSGWSDSSGWTEQQVFIDTNDSVYPYRMIYAALNNGNQVIWMAKSTNGVDWVDNKVILNSKHDSQYSVEILPNGNYLIFTRLWNDPIHTERQIGIMIVTPNGDLIQRPKYLTGGSYYNSASFRLRDNHYVLLPTYYDHYTQDIDIRVCFYIDGKFTDIGQSLNKFLFQDDIIGQPTKWSIIMPNLIPTGEVNTYWMYYYTSNKYHSDLSTRSMIYSRIKIVIALK